MKRLILLLLPAICFAADPITSVKMTEDYTATIQLGPGAVMKKTLTNGCIYPLIKDEQGAVILSSENLKIPVPTEKTDLSQRQKVFQEREAPEKIMLRRENSSDRIHTSESSETKACIGETEREYGRKYGDPFHIEPSEDGRDSLQGWKKSSFLIMVHFHEGRADWVNYQKSSTEDSDPPEQMSSNEIQILLGKNSSSRWIPVNDTSSSMTWKTEDNSLVGTYDERKKSLMIVSKGSVERLLAKKRAAEVKNLQGL